MFIQSRGQLYHHSLWADVIYRSYGFKPYYLYIEDSEHIQSVFPLFHVKLPFFRDEIVSIPHLESGGMIDTSFYAEYLSYIKQHIKAKSIKIYQTREQINDYPSNTGDVILIKELPEKKELIIPGIKASTTRNYTRRVLERDLTVLIENNETALRYFYMLYLQKMREFGTPPHRYAFLKKIAETFRDDAKILLVKMNGEVVGASFYITCSEYLYNLYLVVPQKYMREKIVYLLQYKAMEMGIEQNLRWLVLGRSTTGSGTFFFKSELGGFPVPLYLYHFRLNPEGYEPVQGTTIKEKYHTVSSLWIKLPPFITDSVGPFLRKWVY